MTILGIDEAGRGPWAGPLVVGAVILPTNQPNWINDLTDSKKLTAKNRERLSKIILREAPATGLGWVSAAEIDQIGLASALKLATRRAVKNVQKKQVAFSEIIIDGTTNFLVDTSLSPYVTVLKKADSLIKEVSAASIIAKVARDDYMKKLAQKYPGYGFENHVGYGTAAHRTALADLGPCLEHRFSFRPVQLLCCDAGLVEGVSFGEYKRSATGEDAPKAERRGADSPRVTLAKEMPSTSKGNKAETVVADWLEKNDHQIIARNHKTRFYEIDIISQKNQNLYFTEVKYRQSQDRGTSLEQITNQKLTQMRFAVEAFLKFAATQPSTKSLTKLQPILAAAAVSGSDFHFDKWFPII